MRRLLSLLPLILFCARGAAQPAQVASVQIGDYGVYMLVPQQAAQTSLDGLEQRDVENVRLAEQTRIVHMGKGVHFGFRYAIVGTPIDAPVELRMVTIFPPGGLHKPGASLPILRSEFTVTQTMGEMRDLYHGVALDYDWALVPGNWILEIWCGDRRLTSQTFTLVR